MPIIRPGNTFYFTELADEERHLWVVLTAPQGMPAQVVIVNITDEENSPDTTVRLDKDDHRWVKYPSVVYYGDAHVVNVSPLEREMGGQLTRHSDFASDILKRIQQGLLDSPYTKPDIREYCKGVWEGKK